MSARGHNDKFRTFSSFVQDGEEDDPELDAKIKAMSFDEKKKELIMTLKRRHERKKRIKEIHKRKFIPSFQTSLAPMKTV
jgi:hypothetical protein